LLEVNGINHVAITAFTCLYFQTFKNRYGFFPLFIMSLFLLSTISICNNALGKHLNYNLKDIYHFSWVKFNISIGKLFNPYHNPPRLRENYFGETIKQACRSLSEEGISSRATR